MSKNAAGEEDGSKRIVTGDGKRHKGLMNDETKGEESREMCEQTGTTSSRLAVIDTRPGCVREVRGERHDDKSGFHRAIDNLLANGGRLLSSEVA